MQLLRAGGAGKFIIGNSGGSADATEMASMSGDMIEWFPTQGGAGGQTEDVAWQTNMFGDGHGHLGVFAIDAGITATPNLSFLTGDGWPGTDYYYWTVGPPWLQYARYQAASVSLIDHWCSSFGGTPPIGTRNPPDDLRYNKWPPEMSVDVVTGLSHAASYDISFTGWLGQPLAPYSVVSGVYVRFFEHGCCAINPTSVAKNFTPGVTPTGQAFRRITSNISGDTVNVGGTVGTYSVPAYDAIFLLGDPPDQHAEHSIERAKNTVRLSHRVGAVSMTSIGGSVGMIRTKGGG